MDTVPPTSATDWPRDVGVRWLQLLATGRGTVDVSASTHDGRDGRDWELATADGGRTWHVTGTGTAERPLRQTVWVTPSVGWRGPTHPQVTTDGGRSWRASALPHLDSLSRLSSDGTTLWAQANRCDALDCTTALATGSPTGGLRWITVPGLAHAWDVSAATGAAYVLGANTSDQHGPGVIAVTRNSGRTWQRRVGPCGSGDLVGPGSITATSAYDVEVVCTLYSGAASFRAVDERLFASHDGGRTWTPETLTTPSREGRFADVRVAGGTVWAAVSLRAGNGDGLFWSYDAGRTWEGFPPRALPMAADPTLAVLDARHVVWAYVRRHGDYFQVVVASTADGGRTWHRYLVPRLT
jgi:hypothetical protein